MRRSLAILLVAACVVASEADPQSMDTSADTGSSSSSSSTAAADDAYESDAGAEGCAFACPDPPAPGGGGGSPVGCSIWAQNCPEGEKCMPWANDGGGSWNATRCSPLDPLPAGIGQTCTVEGSGVSGIDDCGVAAMCWAVDMTTLQGTCIAFCESSEANPVCADPSTTCSITNEGVLALCLPLCDPLVQDCGGSDECVPMNDAFICEPDASGDAGAYGDPCEFINVCDPGLFCANANAVPNCSGSSGCCSTFCNLDDADPDATCPGFADGQRCVAWFEAGTAPPGFAHVGACAIPQ